ALFGCEEEEPDYGMDTFAPAVYSEVTQSLDRFQYNPERVRVGTVYHYQKSGITNTWGATLDVYQLNETTIESFKKYSSGSTYVVAGDFDSTLMSFVKQTLYNLDKSGRVESHNFSKVAGRDEFILYDILEQTQSITPVGHYPVFDYSYDSNGIVFLLPHLIDPTSSFEIGMFYVNINIDDKAMIYTGKVQISYQYETSDPKEGCLQAPCLKYSITGEGMMNRQGFLLTNKDQGYVEYMQIPLQNNPTMDGFILQLNGMSEMTQPQWQAHIEKNR
ncbi:MAG: hypothetical protein GY854_33875, partial [Deltaproteobacteria bacterium]|nr:hypothetical protein [Deltaproteobacteria bacterium]